MKIHINTSVYICLSQGTQKTGTFTGTFYRNLILTLLQPVLPTYYRLKMCALLRAFTHFNQNFKIFKKKCKKENVPLRTPRAKKTGTFTGTYFAYP